MWQRKSKNIRLKTYKTKQIYSRNSHNYAVIYLSINCLSVLFKGKYSFTVTKIRWLPSTFTSTYIIVKLVSCVSFLEKQMYCEFMSKSVWPFVNVFVIGYNYEPNAWPMLYFPGVISLSVAILVRCVLSYSSRTFSCTYCVTSVEQHQAAT